MTSWSPTAAPTPQPAPLPGMRLPRILLAVGLAVLCLGVATFTYTMMSRYTVNTNDNMLLPGGMADVVLRADQDYGLSSADLQTTCAVTSPNGEAVSVTPPSFSPYGSQPEILRFRTTDAGTYHVACASSRDVIINKSRDTIGFTVVQWLFVLSLPALTVGLALTLTGGIWGAFRRARHRRLMLAELAARPAVTTPEMMTGPSWGPAAPWGTSAPSEASVPSGTSAPGWPSAPSGRSGAGRASAAGTVPPGPGPTPTDAGYGIAPHHVEYRPSSPGTGPQILPSHSEHDAPPS